MVRTAGEDFYLDMIKPSHYDDDGYVIQWARGWLPSSNTLACLYALATDAAERKVLGEDTNLVVTAHDETDTIVPIDKIIRRITGHGGKARGLVCLVGVQSNQFLRAMHIAQPFLDAGIDVAIGGFHVSGCVATLDDLPFELKVAVKRGMTLFAGEVEGRFDELLVDAHQGRLKSVYNTLAHLPDIRHEPPPFLPLHMVRRTAARFSSFDAGRGCPFDCSFCCIVNVQGHKSRFREADRIADLVRRNAARGITKYFVTDDNFARNRNWEPIFDRLIELREREGIAIHFVIQVDMMVHRQPRFIEKAAAAGCRYVFLGLESVSPDNLADVNKIQNKLPEFRRMLLAWKKAGVITFAGYILGFPNDTPASIRRDIATVQRELPVDILEFFVMSPVPGSQDHKRMRAEGVWMDADLNKGDAEHVVTEHPKMTKEEWQDIYREAWSLYYSPEHIERLIRRTVACGVKPVRLTQQIIAYSGMPRFEGVHPLQGGLFRRKHRLSRRPGFPREKRFAFYLNRLREIATTYGGFFRYGLTLHRLRRRIQRDPNAASYTDAALSLEEYQGEPAEPEPDPVASVVATSVPVTANPAAE